jgi:hypothetical protein
MTERGEVPRQPEPDPARGAGDENAVHTQ